MIGVDTTEAMLTVAREKVPAADFRSGRLEQLPVEDESVDLITCALALTHVERLGPVMREFVRVLRPGGQAILTDIHPVATMTGTIAGFLTATSPAGSHMSATSLIRSANTSPCSSTSVSRSLRASNPALPNLCCRCFPATPSCRTLPAKHSSTLRTY